ncbi:Riboflavin synthase [Hondaea fermentalgiana]|uniref:Riboflavin synthase n=1 Tax=Hondaea fermentalgiana TaxID=2315210 RepID=A0A2R5GG00_9STRA|nr:Riboflavin synthase [Hondaea fermentalgiana]|eukprot:GBG28688.1 Riboflavin synthase [Hondaea fermentalgiana]
MFTGIVEEMGKVVSMGEQDGLELWDGSTGTGYVLVVECKVALDGCYLGASISINGVCLTATAFDESTVTFGVAPETIRRTNLVKLKPGDPVNVERAAKMNDRNSGHYVQGHVDGTGKIVKKVQEGDSLWITVEVPPELQGGIVHKGFIAIDGTSLTVCDVDSAANTFNFMLVAHTQTAVIIPQKDIGQEVNLELDVMGKFVQQSMQTLNDRVAALESKVSEQLGLIMQRLECLEVAAQGKQ